MKTITLSAALLALASSVAQAGNWHVNFVLHQEWWGKPVADFFAANGPPNAKWNTVAGVAGLGAHYRWEHGRCRVLIRTVPDGTMAELDAYGACDGVVK
jgi:hypothetical protein